MAIPNIILYLVCFVDFLLKDLSKAARERIYTSNSKQIVTRNTVDSGRHGTYVTNNERFCVKKLLRLSIRCRAGISPPEESILKGACFPLREIAKCEWKSCNVMLPIHKIKQVLISDSASLQVNKRFRFLFFRFLHDFIVHEQERL